MASVNLLSTKGVSKHYSGLMAVNDVDFELPHGQIRALIGPNGAGKTTFVGLLSGRIPATTGSVFFDGQEVTTLPAHRRMSLGMAYTFQITSVFSKLDVNENVALAARRVHAGNRAAVNEAIEQALLKVNLQDYRKQIAGDMSYGHQRLLEIAMGLAQSPKLFILDEPTQGLTATEVDAFKKLIKELSGETTILLIEHNMDVVMSTAEYITVLNFGEVLAEGTPAVIRNNDAVQAAYLGKG
jgi:branched-chain amino acid transport system ATP-binding protein